MDRQDTHANKLLKNISETLDGPYWKVDVDQKRRRPAHPGASPSRSVPQRGAQLQKSHPAHASSPNKKTSSKSTKTFLDPDSSACNGDRIASPRSVTSDPTILEIAPCLSDSKEQAPISPLKRCPPTTAERIGSEQGSSVDCRRDEVDSESSSPLKTALICDLPPALSPSVRFNCGGISSPRKRHIATEDAAKDGSRRSVLKPTPPCGRDLPDRLVVLGDTELPDALKRRDIEVLDYPRSDNWHLPSIKKYKEAQWSTLEQLRLDKQSKRQITRHCSPTPSKDSSSMNGLGSSTIHENNLEITKDNSDQSASDDLSFLPLERQGLNCHSYFEKPNVPGISPPLGNCDAAKENSKKYSCVGANPVEPPDLPSFRSDFIVDDGFGYSDDHYKWSGYTEAQLQKMKQQNPLSTNSSIRSTADRHGDLYTSKFADSDFSDTERIEDTATPCPSPGYALNRRSARPNTPAETLIDRWSQTAKTKSSKPFAFETIRARVVVHDQNIIVPCTHDETVHELAKKIENIYEELTSVRIRVERLESKDGFVLLPSYKVSDTIRDNDDIRAKINHHQPLAPDVLYCAWCKENHTDPSPVVLERLTTLSDQLNFRYCNLCFLDPLLSIMRLHAFQSIDLGFNALDHDAILPALKALSSRVPDSPSNLLFLSLSHNKIGHLAVEANFFSSLSKISQLTKLDLSSNPLTDRCSGALAICLKELSCLTFLNLKHTLLTFRTLKRWRDRQVQLGRLKHLILSYNTLTQDGLFDLVDLVLDSDPLQLEKLELAHTCLFDSLNDSEATNTKNSAPSSPRYYNDSNRFIHYLHRLHENSAMPLEYLDISGNPLNKSLATSEILYAIGKLSHRLYYLNLSGCSIGADDIQSFFSELRTNSVLQILILNLNPLGSTVCTQIPLAHNPRLSHLELKSCDLRKDGVLKVIQSTTNNSSLQHLDLSDNCVFDTPATPDRIDKLLEEVFQCVKTSKLKNLLLCWNGFDSCPSTHDQLAAAPPIDSLLKNHISKLYPTNLKL